MALHVVAMARTRNTARSDPYELPRATMADHIWAITTTTDKETWKSKIRRVDPQPKQRGVKLKMLNQLPV